MQATFARSDALRLTAQVAGIVKSRMTIPILTNLLLEAEGDDLTVTATDLDMWAQARIPAKVGKRGAVTVNASDLTTILKGAADGPVTLELGERRLTLTTGSGRYQLPTLAAEDFPRVPDASLPEPVEIDADGLGGLLERVAFAACADMAGKYAYLCGVYLEPRGDTLRAVATDVGYLALAEIPTQGLDGIEAAIIPTPVVDVMRRALKDADVGRLSLSKHVVRLEANGLTIQAKTLDGAFPPTYERAIPEGPHVPCAVETAALRAALARVVPFPDEKEVPIRFVMEPGAGSIRARVVKTSVDAEEALALAYEGEPRQPGFSGRRLSRICQHFSGETMQLGHETGRGMAITDAADPSYRFSLATLRGSE